MGCLPRCEHPYKVHQKFDEDIGTSGDSPLLPPLIGRSCASFMHGQFSD